MTDLNALIPANSPLYLMEATGSINDLRTDRRYGVDMNGDFHAFLATPTFDASTATAATGMSRPRTHITAPEAARELMQRRLLPFSRFQGGALRLQ